MRLEQAPDGLLAERAADGDNLAFAVLVRRHGPFLRAFATKLMRNRADADDVVQDALITAWRKLGDLKQPERVRAWLATAVSRRAADVRRTAARRATGELSEDVPARESESPARIAQASATQAAFDAALDRLPDDQREVWVLRELGDLSYDDIAGRLDISAATVRGRLSRARAALMAEMAAWR